MECVHFALSRMYFVYEFYPLRKWLIWLVGYFVVIIFVVVVCRCYCWDLRLWPGDASTDAKVTRRRRKTRKLKYEIAFITWPPQYCYRHDNFFHHLLSSLMINNEMMATIKYVSTTSSNVMFTNASQVKRLCRHHWIVQCLAILRVVSHICESGAGSLKTELHPIAQCMQYYAIHFVFQFKSTTRKNLSESICANMHSEYKIYKCD